MINYKQGPDQATHEYVEKMVARLEVLKLANVLLCIGDKEALFKKMKTLCTRYIGDKKKNSIVYSKTRKERVSDWNNTYLTPTMVMQNLDPARFSKLKSEL